MMATTAGQSFKQENVFKLLFSETTEPFESKVYRWQTQRDNNSYHDPLGRWAKKKARYMTSIPVKEDANLIGFQLSGLWRNMD